MKKMRLKFIWFVSFFIIFALSTPMLSQSISQDSTTMTSRGTVYYTSSTATLKFATGFELPIYWASKVTGNIKLSGGDVSSFSFSTSPHYWQDDLTGGGRAAIIGTEIDVDLDSFGYQGRSLKFSVLDPHAWHNELEFDSLQNTFSDVFVRYWTYFPADFDISYTSFFATLEYPSAGMQSFKIPIKKGGGGPSYLHFWATWENYAVGDGYYEWEYHSDTAVPVGRWFKFEVYIERRTDTSGTMRAWIDGVPLNWKCTIHRALPEKVGQWTQIIEGQTRTAGAEHWHMRPFGIYGLAPSQNYPLFRWADDLEIWDGIPP